MNGFQGYKENQRMKIGLKRMTREGRNEMNTALGEITMRMLVGEEDQAEMER